MDDCRRAECKVGEEGVPERPHERGGEEVIGGDAILQTVRVSKDNDPVEAWQKHNASLKARYEKLNACHFESLHYFSENGTDFTCGLIPDAQWMGGGETLLDGTFFNPNMPTEEIFTSPMKGKAEGMVVSTMPLSYQGNLIENFSITFKDGRAVSARQKRTRSFWST